MVSLNKTQKNMLLAIGSYAALVTLAMAVLSFIAIILGNLINYLR